MVSGATTGKGGPRLAKHVADSGRHRHNYNTCLGDTRDIISDTIEDAIVELTRVVSHVKSCCPLYHIHLDPKERWTSEQCARYWFLLEKEFGLAQQPFVEAIHDKSGRVHYHRVYSRVQADGKVIPIHHDYARREKIGRIVELEFGGAHVTGRHNRAVAYALRREGRFDVLRSITDAGLLSAPRPIAKMTPAQRHQSARTKVDPPEITTRTYCIWQLNWLPGELLTLLSEQGLRLVQGFKVPIIIDEAGGAHSLTRIVGSASAATGARISAKEVLLRLSDVTLSPYQTTGVFDARDKPAVPTKLDAKDNSVLDRSSRQGNGGRSGEQEENSGKIRQIRYDCARRGHASYIQDHTRDEGQNRPVDGPTRGRRTDATGEDDFVAGSTSSSRDQGAKGTSRTRQKDSSPRSGDHRAAIIFEFCGIAQSLDSLLLKSSMLDHYSYPCLKMEAYRIERILKNSKLMKKVHSLEVRRSALSRLASYLITLASKVVSGKHFPAASSPPHYSLQENNLRM